MLQSIGSQRVRHDLATEQQGSGRKPRAGEETYIQAASQRASEDRLSIGPVPGLGSGTGGNR